MFQACEWTFAGDEGTRKAFVEFDLSTIPAGSTINSSFLSLYGFIGAEEHSTLSGSNEATIRRVIDSWNESTITWNNQPGYSTTNEVILPQSTSPGQDYPNIDVSAMVQDMVDNPTSSHGFMFSLVSTQYYRRMTFCSSDHADSTKHPKLEITYTPVGINENTNLNTFRIYPNPSDGKFTISSVQLINEMLEMYDVMGRKVKELRVAGYELQVDVSDLTGGIYLWKLGEARGKVVIE